MGRERVWMENPYVLCSLNMIPTLDMTVNQRVNALTRMVFVIFIILLFFRYEYSIHFLLISVLIILILYFVSSKEPFAKMDTPRKYKYPLLDRTMSEKKMSIPPIIVPRSHDKDVWSFPSHQHSAVNSNNMRYNISDDYTPIPVSANYKELDPRLETYTGFNLSTVGQYCDEREKAKQQQSTPIQQVIPSSPQSTPIQQVIPSSKESFYPLYPQEQRYSYPQSERPKIEPSAYQSRDYADSGYFKQGRADMFANYPTIKNENPQSRYSDHNFQTIPNTDPQSSQVKNPAEMVINKNDTERFQNIKGPIDDFMIPKTLSTIYGPGGMVPEERVKYFENIQPNQYSFQDLANPINATLGIAYTPSLPPRVLDQVVGPYGVEPLYHRIDPQLVRDDVPDQRRDELPPRNGWSAKYNNFDAQGSVNFEDIYDPRFNGHGDEFRSYGDVNLGQVQYYYSDIDAYRSNLFPFRSKVDFVDYTDPNGRVLPEYPISVGVDDIRKEVENQYTADNLYFRTDMMEKLMRKRNEEMFQLRSLPLRRDNFAHSFTSHN